MQKFQFLCGNFQKTNCIYAIKFDKQPWHYFEKIHSTSAVHNSLPAALDPLIGTLKQMRTIEVPLDEIQSRNYYVNGKFVFKEKQLKTHLQLDNLNGETSKANSKDTSQLIFISGQTNPLFFLNDYEKCEDVKTDKNKMFKIRNFVDDLHRVEFSELSFTSDWPTIREVFLKKYSKAFTANKKKNLKIDFDEEISLRSFFERKLKSLSTYTSLPFVNQVEIVLFDLPTEISTLFLVNETMTKKKAEILEFCDSIQDLVEALCGVPEEENRTIQDPLNQMEVFDYDPNSNLDEPQAHSSTSTNRPARKQNASRSGESDLSNQTSDSSQSSFSDMVVAEPDSVSINTSQQSVRKRGRPRGSTTVRGKGSRTFLKSIEEGSEGTVQDYLNTISDTSSSTGSMLSRTTRTSRSRPY